MSFYRQHARCQQRQRQTAKVDGRHLSAQRQPLLLKSRPSQCISLPTTQYHLSLVSPRAVVAPPGQKLQQPELPQQRAVQSMPQQKNRQQQRPPEKKPTRTMQPWPCSSSSFCLRQLPDCPLRARQRLHLMTDHCRRLQELNRQPGNPVPPSWLVASRECPRPSRWHRGHPPWLMQMQKCRQPVLQPSQRQLQAGSSPLLCGPFSLHKARRCSLPRSCCSRRPSLPAKETSHIPSYLSRLPSSVLWSRLWSQHADQLCARKEGKPHEADRARRQT
mmetsp:Transcript_5018/g.14671  ORF Transcript_5018/g.14671 Transcript_5018/m.14671 type:complete len:275 (+) Transcript_5018:225-1049(+)